MNLKKVVGLIVIAVGVFTGIVMPSQDHEQVKVEARGINKMPSWDYWGMCDTCTEQITKENPWYVNWGIDESYSITNPRLVARDYNFGEQTGYYLYIDETFYLELMKYYDVSEYDQPELKDVPRIEIFNPNSSFQYVMYTDNTRYEGPNETFEFTQDPQTGHYYVYLEHLVGNNVSINWDADTSWNYHNFKIQITQSRMSSSDTFYNYIPYNQPFQVVSGITLLDVSVSSQNIVYGDEYYIEVTVDNPKGFIFDQIVIDGDSYRVDSSQSVNQIGDEYIIKIPFSNTTKYGDVIHTIEKVIVKEPTNQLDYDILEIQQSITFSSVDSFTQDIIVKEVSFDKTTAYFTDPLTLSLMIENPSNIELTGISINNQLYTNITNYGVSPIEKTLDGALMTNQHMIDNDPELQEIIAYINSIKTASNDYFVQYISDTNSYRIIEANGSTDTTVIYSNYVRQKYLYGGVWQNRTNSCMTIFDWDSVNNTWTQNGSSSGAVTHNSHTFVWATKDIYYFDSSLADTTDSYLSESYNDLYNYSYTISMNTPQIEGTVPFNLNYLQFKNIIDSKTYHEKMATTNSLSLNVTNPTDVSNISNVTWVLDKTTLFSDDYITATLTFDNPDMLNLDYVYVNGENIGNFINNDPTYNNSYTLTIPVQEFYYLNVQELFISKLVFSDTYNSQSIQNDYIPSGTNQLVDIVNTNFASNVDIKGIQYNKSYYLYGDQLTATLNLNNPDLVRLSNIKINNIQYDLTKISDTQYQFTMDVPQTNYGLISVPIQTITFTDLNSGLTKELISQDSLSFELYTSSDVADVNVTSFNTNYENIYLFNDEQYLEIQLNNTTNLIPRSIMINGYEYKNLEYDQLNKIITVPLMPIRNIETETYIISLQQITFLDGSQIKTKTLSMDLIKNVDKPYQQQIEEINNNYEINWFNKVIFLVIVNPLLNFVFPLIDNMSINHPGLMTFVTYFTLITSCLTITYFMFRKEIHRVFRR